MGATSRGACSSTPFRPLDNRMEKIFRSSPIVRVYSTLASLVDEGQTFLFWASSLLAPQSYPFLTIRSSKRRFLSHRRCDDDAVCEAPLNRSASPRERVVMRDHHQCAGIFSERILEAFDRGDIKMIG